jgi:zinc transport system substrate-binding protein
VYNTHERENDRDGVTHGPGFYHSRRDRVARVEKSTLLLALCVVMLAACDGCKGKNSQRTKVVCSIFPVYDLTRKVAGPDADVMLLLPPGQNEHEYTPTSKEIEEVAQTKLGVMVGLGLDSWMDKVMTSAAPKAHKLVLGTKVKTRTIDLEMTGDEAADKARDSKEHHDEHEKGAIDPHVWLDPQRARTMLGAIRDELCIVDVAHCHGYEQRAQQADESLQELDKEIEARMKALKTRGFITFHGSFGYFAERYDLQILAVIEPFPGAVPTGEYIKQVLEVVSDKKVPAIFSEPQLDPRPAKTIAEAAKIPLGVLDPVGGNKDTDSYEKMIRFDAAALEQYMK